MEQLQQLKTFKDALKVEKVKGWKVKAFLTLLVNIFKSKQDRDAIIAFMKLIIIIRAANRLANGGQSWTPNWSDSNWKWTPYFDLSGGAVGFRFSVVDGWSEGSLSGSRLCYFSEAAALHVVKQKEFLAVYAQFMLVK